MLLSSLSIIKRPYLILLLYVYYINITKGLILVVGLGSLALEVFRGLIGNWPSRAYILGLVAGSYNRGIGRTLGTRLIF